MIRFSYKRELWVQPKRDILSSVKTAQPHASLVVLTTRKLTFGFLCPGGSDGFLWLLTICGHLHIIIF